MDSFGLAKISDATDVTDANSGLVMSAMQNNASVPGTLRNQVQAIQSTIQLGGNSYRHIGHFENEEHYYVSDPGYIEVRNGIAYVHINYAIAKEPIYNYESRVILLTNVPKPEQNLWIHLESYINSKQKADVLVEFQERCISMFRGEKEAGYRIDFSYPIAWE